MSTHTDALRDIAANHGWPVCDLAADEIEDLERAYELLFAENAKLRASHTSEAEPVARYSFVCNAGCGACTVKVAPFEHERTETIEGEHLGSKYQPQIVSSCCGAEVHVYDNEADHWGAEVTLAAPGAAIAAREQCPKVYLVATGETHEGHETYTRHDERPPLCECEVLTASREEAPAASERAVADELLAFVKKIANGEVQDHMFTSLEDEASSLSFRAAALLALARKS